MKRSRNDWEKPEQASRLSNIEDNLRVIYQPVKPRPSYIEESRSRLLRATQDKSSRFVALQLLIIAMAGLASAVFILVLSVRTTITILSTLGLLHLFRQEIRNKRAVKMSNSPTIPAPTGELQR
jgi:hypothetical protein